MTAPLRHHRPMLARMAPRAVPGDVVFCTTANAARLAEALPHARAMMREAEGTTLVLPVETARLLRYDTALRMRQITLSVHSALEGVGLTAAVSATLAEAGIACNVIAGFHHDHLFVPARRLNAALRALKRLAA